MLNSADHYAKVGKPAQWIETVSGDPFHFEKPTFQIDVVAHALGMMCRYNGHCRKFYSIAEHSLLVCLLVERLELGDPLEGLLHDGHEAYMPDMTSPLKAMMPEYRVMEHSIEVPFRAHYGLKGDKVSEGVKRADWLALFIEARHLMPTQGRDWFAPPGIKEEAAAIRDIIPHGYTPEVARDHFLNAFRELGYPRGLRW